MLKYSAVWAGLRTAGFVPKERAGTEGLRDSDVTRCAFQEGSRLLFGVGWKEGQKG